MMRVVAALMLGVLLVRGFITAFYTTEWVIVFRMDSGLRNQELNKWADDASYNIVAYYSIFVPWLLVGIAHCALPVVPGARALCLRWPWFHYATMWVFMLLFGLIAVWEMHVRRDPMFELTCVYVAFSIMGSMFLFRHWCAYLVVATFLVAFAWPALLGTHLSIRFYEPYTSPIFGILVLGVWHRERQDRHLYSVKEAVAHEAAARATGEKEALAAKEEALAAQKAADEAREAESRFLARMSHEIRTPLSGLLGFLDLLEKTQLSKEQREIIQSMGVAGGLLKIVVNDILDLSKSQAGMMQLSPQSRPLRQTISGAVAVFAALLASKRLTHDVHIADGIPEDVTIDHVRVQQMLTNLLSNAIKFTERGSIQCRVTPVLLATGKNGLKVEVRDTGIGIPAQAIPRLFQDFAQADHTMSRQYGGTGLLPPLLHP